MLDVFQKVIEADDVGRPAILACFPKGEALLKKIPLGKAFKITTKGRSVEENRGMFGCCEYAWEDGLVPESYIEKWRLRSKRNLYDALKIEVGFSQLFKREGDGAVIIIPRPCDFDTLDDEIVYQEEFKKPARRFLAETVIGIGLVEFIEAHQAWRQAKKFYLQNKKREGKNDQFTKTPRTA